MGPFFFFFENFTLFLGVLIKYLTFLEINKYHKESKKHPFHMSFLLLNYISVSDKFCLGAI